MSNLYEYLTESEKEILLEEVLFENEELSIVNEFKKCELDRIARSSDIETKALLGEYTEAQLCDLYEEESKLYYEATDNAWTKFTNWLQGIMNKILGKKVEEDKIENPEQVVDIGYDVDGCISLIDVVKNSLGNFFSENSPVKFNLQNLGSFIKDSKVVDFFTKHGSSLINGFKGSKKVKKKEVPGLMGKLKNSLKGLTDGIFGHKENMESQKGSFLSSIFNKVVSAGNSMVSHMQGLITKAKEKIVKEDVEDEDDFDFESYLSMESSFDEDIFDIIDRL